MKKYLTLTNVLIVFLILFIVVLAFLPVLYGSMGGLMLSTPRTITVNGTAEKQEQNQVAEFTAGVTSVNDDKQAAVTEVNEQIKTIIDRVKEFGISNDNIKTENINIYQRQEMVYEEGRETSKPGAWEVSNSIRIKLKDASRTSELADLLASTGATNVWGPNFSLEESEDSELVIKAYKNAYEKAEKLANSTGSKVGKALHISVGGSVQGPIMERAYGMGGGGTPVEPGSSTVSKNVTVTFELK